MLSSRIIMKVMSRGRCSKRTSHESLEGSPVNLRENACASEGVWVGEFVYNKGLPTTNLLSSTTLLNEVSIMDRRGGDAVPR